MSVLETARNISRLSTILELYSETALTRKRFGIGYVYIYIFVFLRMTDTVTSQDIDLSSWNTLYKKIAVLIFAAVTTSSLTGYIALPWLPVVMQFPNSYPVTSGPTERTGARGRVVVKTLCYKPECRGIASRRGGFFLIYLIFSAKLWPWGRISL
jgi:hypothetical protein